MSFLPCQPNQSRQKKPISGKPQAVKPAQKDVVQKKLAPDKTKGLRLLKETPQASLVQKKPAPKPAPDEVENLAKEYLAELKEVDLTFEKEQPSSRNIETVKVTLRPEWAGDVIPGRPNALPCFILPSQRSATATGFGDYPSV